MGREDIEARKKDSIFAGQFIGLSLLDLTEALGINTIGHSVLLEIILFTWLLNTFLASLSFL